MMNLLTKYKPKKLDETIGNKKQMIEVLNFIKKYKKGKALFIYGPPGCGKTLCIELVADELGGELIRITSSDFCDYENIKKTVLASAKQRSLEKRKKIILIDDVDYLSDRGMKRGLKELISQSIYPVVLIAENPFTENMKDIRSYCKLIKFDKIRSDSLRTFLEKIAKKEKIKYDEKALAQMAKAENGDVRAALIDMETMSEITDKSVFSERRMEQSIFDTLKIIFKAHELENSRIALSQSDKTPEEVFWWLEENITKEYTKPEDIASAYRFLSYADFFQSLIIKRQSWGMYKYFFDMLTSINVSSKDSYRKFVFYQPPKFFMQLKRQKPKGLSDVCKKIGKMTHTSNKVAMSYIPLIKVLIRNGSRFNFDKEDIEAIRNVKAIL